MSVRLEKSHILAGIAAVVVLLLVITISSSLFVVHEWEQVVLTQFGDPVGDPITESGLHFKLPFVQKINRFEKRILVWDGERNQIPTDDKRFIWVDTTARWRIRDPLVFLQSVRTIQGAQFRLDDYLDSAVRDVIGRNKLVEAVRLSNRVVDLATDDEERGAGPLEEERWERIQKGRDELIEAMLNAARPKAEELGIELIDLRIKRINYVESVRESVYERMISERQRIAEQYRSEGRGKKAEIEGQRTREEKTILSEAYRKAQEIIATADAEAARIFAQAYDADAEFYAFWRTLEAYKEAVGTNHTLVIGKDSPLYRYLERD